MATENDVVGVALPLFDCYTKWPNVNGACAMRRIRFGSKRHVNSFPVRVFILIIVEFIIFYRLFLCMIIIILLGLCFWLHLIPEHEVVGYLF